MNSVYCEASFNLPIGHSSREAAVGLFGLRHCTGQTSLFRIAHGLVFFEGVLLDVIIGGRPTFPVAAYRFLFWVCSLSLVCGGSAAAPVYQKNSINTGTAGMPVHSPKKPIQCQLKACLCMKHSRTNRH